MKGTLDLTHNEKYTVTTVSERKPCGILQTEKVNLTRDCDYYPCNEMYLIDFCLLLINSWLTVFGFWFVFSFALHVAFMNSLGRCSCHATAVSLLFCFEYKYKDLKNMTTFFLSYTAMLYTTSYNISFFYVFFFVSINLPSFLLSVRLMITGQG